MDDTTVKKDVSLVASPSKVQGFLAGIASGCTKLLVGHPFDTVKVRLQTEGLRGRFEGPLHCIKATVLKEGPLALYKGATPPLFGWALTDSIQAGTYTNVKNFLSRELEVDPKKMYYVHALAGLTGGWVSSITATPMEQIKARLQVQYDGTTRHYTGPIDCVQQLVRQKGVIRGLWSGFSATLLFRSNFAILWPVYQYTSRTMESWNADYLNPAIPFLAGGTAATFFWIAAFPSDLIKNRIMSQKVQPGLPLKYPNLRAAITSVYKSEGILGFYRGFLPAILRSFPTNGAALMAYEFVMSYKPFS